MRAPPSNKDLTARLPSDVLNKRGGFTKAEWDRSMVAFLDLDPAGQQYELSRATEVYRTIRKRLPPAWREAIAAGLDLFGSLAGLRPAVRAVVAADLRRRLTISCKGTDDRV